MENKKYVLGLDLGVASIGWGCVTLDDNDIPNGILDHGVVTFKSLDNDKGQLYNQTRREKRSQRRVIRRRKERIRRIKNLLLNTFDMKEKEYNDLFHAEGVCQDNDILNLNIKGLSEELSKEQLIRVLINYAKNRGFKSNRKINSDNEKGKMKKAINNITEVKNKYNCTISKAILIYQQENNLDVRHNTGENYNYGFERNDIREEIELLLDKQIEFGLIDDNFKNKYLDIWSSQRDFSEGPATGPYVVRWDKMVGMCKFRTNERRISKACPSFEFFALVQKLHNITYYVIDENKEIIKDSKGKKAEKFSLTKEEINYLFEKAKKSDIKYNDIIELVKKNRPENYDIRIVDMPSITKKKFNDLVKEYYKENDIKDRKLNDDEYAEIKSKAYEESKKIIVFELKMYKEFKKQLKKLNKSEKIEDIEFLDYSATILSYAQTDAKIDELVNSEEYVDRLNNEEKELIKKLEIKTKGTGNLCLSLTKDLLDCMLDGYNYNEAMKELGYDHSDTGHKEFKNGFPTVQEIESTYDTRLTNPNVKHTLVYLRRLYNTLNKKYGEPYRVHIELARDISKSYTDRLEIRRNQLDNYSSRQSAKLEMFEELGLSDIENRKYPSFSNDDILKFRLWEEQKHICPYSGREISRNELLTSMDLHVDHILPFSRSFDDSYTNKVLVYVKANEDKGNKTPYEWFGKDKARWNAFKDRIRDNKNYSEKKINNLLNEDEVTFDEFSSRSLNATTYMSKLALNIFKDLLNKEDGDDRVLAFKGGATSFLRKYYRLNNCIHSFASKNYRNTDIVYIIDEDNVVSTYKNNEVSFTISALDKYGNVLEYEFKLKNDSKKPLTGEDKDNYDLIKYHSSELKEYFIDNICGKDINKIDDFRLLSYMKEDENNKILVAFAFDALNKLKAKLIEKNRNNNLHHEVDALLVATMTRSMQMKIAKFTKLIRSNKFTDPDTGEHYDNIDALTNKYNIDTAIKDKRYYMPQPYDHFVDELIIRVFERDEKVLNEKLTNLLGYQTNAKVKYPSFQADKKVSGALHEETIFGRRKLYGKDVMVLRKSVFDIKEKDLKNIYDGDGGQAPVKQALIEWFKLTEKDRKEQRYPIHPKTGQYIKKIKMIGDDINKMVRISKDDESKGYAGIGKVARIQIYKKEDDDKLYYVQLSTIQYMKRKNNDFDFTITVWWGQGNSKEYLLYSELENKGYKLYLELYPGQIIYIGDEFGGNLVKTIGFTSGQFKIGSVIGDGIDLIENKIQNKIKPEYYLTAPKKISIGNIDILGYVL